jgi:hypothetical protein
MILGHNLIGLHLRRYKFVAKNIASRMVEWQLTSKLAARISEDEETWAYFSCCSLDDVIKDAEEESTSHLIKKRIK